MCKKNWHKARGGRRSKNYSPEASLLLFAANFPTLRGEEVYLSTSGWSEVRTILHRNVVPTYGLTYWHSYFLLLNVMKNQIGLENE